MKLKAYLAQAHISQARFAEMIGLSDRQCIARYIAGRMPRADVMIRIKTATNGAVMPNDFLPDTPAE